MVKEAIIVEIYRTVCLITAGVQDLPEEEERGDNSEIEGEKKGGVR